MLPRIAHLWRDEEGLTTVEYALLLALLAVAAVAAWGDLGCKVGWTAWRVGRYLRR
ncbi:MAG: Flp family type IVb pilin [Armatimonadetes bacterium]|nr:Flp family type IVb pilin [Armatimonadota bacterium]